MFVERSKALLKPGGRFYLVTKQLDQVEPLVRAAFGEPELYESRGYIILVAGG
jgi:16S rRNA G1207 methylase RsmC